MKKLAKATGILGLAMITIFVIVFGFTLINANALFVNETFTERELYNATNTYNVDESCLDNNGNVKVTPEVDREMEIDQYHLSYDMSAKNGNQVMSITQATVLTHGLGGSARHWSNNFSETNYKDDNVKFAYDKDSLISRIDEEVGGANIYWAKVDKKEGSANYDYNIFDITNQKTQNEAYNRNIKVEHIEDISKHIIIIFEAYAPLGSNDNIYYQFNYMMSKIAYDLKVLNGGLLPKFNLIGHSRGGITNLQYALDHPDMVDSLVSLGTPYFGSTTANLFGRLIITDPSDGLPDILDADLYYSYNKRWNDNYETLYKNINANAFGSFHTLISLMDAISNNHSELLSTGAVVGIDIGLVYLTSWLLNPKLKVSSFRLSLILMTSILDYLFPNDKAVDFAEILLKEINADIIPNVPSWYSDLLVPLKSQLAIDEGSITHFTLGYKGFHRRVRPFLGFDANYIKISDPMPPIGHNLEARDSVIINWVLSVLKFGTLEFMTQEKEDGTIKIVGYNGVCENGELVIPEAIGEKPVTEIERFAFSNLDKSGIVKITLPDTVKTIGAYAFSDFTNVTEIAFGGDSELERVEQGAFNNCTSLQSITLPKNVEFVFGVAFTGCNSLSNVYVSADNAHYTSVGGVLYRKDMEILIYYPQGKTDTAYTVDSACVEINPYAIGNPNLQSLNLNNVVMIRQCGVANCVNLQSLIADKLGYVESGVFANTKVFDGVEGDLISVGKVLFAYNGDATNLTVSDGFKSIAPFAFAGNETLETVVLEGNTIGNIGNGAFFCCDKLSTVYIKNLNNTVYVGDGVFDDGVQNIYVSEPLKSEYDNSEDWQEYADKLAVHTTTVSFESDGGSECADKSMPYGSYIGELPAPTRNGYIFEGWHRVADLSDLAVSQADLWDEITDGVTFYAKWEPVRYAVWFVVDLQTGATDTALDRTYDTEEDIVFGVSEKTGYTFGGWYTDRELTQAAGTGFAAGETGDKTYYAKWIANKISVTLNVNDSEKFPATVATTSGEAEYDSTDFAFTVPTRAGFEFNGWYADVGGQRLFLTDADGKAVKKWNIAAESIELYADWTRSTYYIKIDADGKIVWLGADGFSETKTPIEFGTVFDTADDMEKAFNPEKLSLKEGHKFKYFTLQDGSRFSLWESIANKFAPDETIEISAVFEKEINFSIDFYGQETGINNPFIGAFGDMIVYYPASKTGYTFKHWIVTENDNLNEKFVGTLLAPGTVFDYTHMPDLSIGYEEDGTHIYLEAVFEANEYQVTFETLRGTAPSPVIIFYDEIKTFETVYVVGYDFIGWETADGRMITNSDGNMLAAWDIASDQTLYAKWEIIEYTITYVLNGGINHSGNVTKYTIESPTITLYDATRDGHRFMGWYNYSDFSGNSVSSIPHGSHGDRTFHADFAKIYTVYFNANGGTYVSPMTGIAGQEITLPTSVKKDHRGTWNYWGYLTDSDKESNFGKQYVIGNTDITLTANWKKTKLTVTFYIEDGSGRTTSTVAEYGKKMPQIDLPTRTAHNFMGYYTERYGGGTRYYEFYDPRIYPDDYYDNVLATYCDFDDDTTLYAYWQPMSWSIDLMPHLSDRGYVIFEDTAKFPRKIGLSYNQQYIYNVPEHLGYHFDNWVLNCAACTVATGKDTAIDLTNLCVGNYSSYALILNYEQNCGEANGMKVVILGKVDSTWQLQLTNLTGSFRYFEYNAKMCFNPDARDWSGLKDVVYVTDSNGNKKYVPNNSSVRINITEYGTATSIAISYIEGDNRQIFYANKLNAVYRTMEAKANTVSATQDDSCVAEGTLITLADGSKKAVEDLTGNESLLVWNLHTGSFDRAPIIFVDKDPVRDYRVINLTFSDGTVIKVISEHGFWDVDLHRYVYLDENAAEFIGHRFMKQSGSGMTEVTLTNVEIRTETTRAYSPVTYGHLCYYVNGMLSMPGGITGLFNIFETCGDLPRYDADAMAADIDAYGLFTYEEFRQTYLVSEEVFEAFNGRYLKVAIGKGLIMQERIGELIERYSEFFRT